MKLKRICIFVFIFSVVWINVFATDVIAQIKPWEPYQKYIPDKMPVTHRHLRATWICTVINLDWPSVETRKISNDRQRIQKSKEELIAILDKSAELNINAVFFQISPTGDAFYKSNIVNWSRYLTGTFGKDPGFDPLAFAIEEAHKRNIELHAWFNPYRISMNTSDATKRSLNIERSVFKEHPEWIRTANNRFVVDPGIPEARDWVIKRVMEVVENYDIDGIHFDDYFYYEKYEGELKDGDTFQKYNLGQFSNLRDWRRNNTYILIKELSDKISEAKPWVKFGISPAGVWGNKKDGHPDGSNTNGGFTNYDRSFADTKKWVEEEIIDYIAPQIYFTFANTRVPYGEIAEWWSNLVEGKNVHLYIGQALYRINDGTEFYFQGENGIQELVRQMKYNAMKPQVMGSILFRFQNFNDSDKQPLVNITKNELWTNKALVPVMPWKAGNIPQTPTTGNIEKTHNGIKISWIDYDKNTTYYAIYRKNSEQGEMKLIETLRKRNQGKQEYVDQDQPKNNDINTVTYFITAVDRLHNESNQLVIYKNKRKNEASAWAMQEIEKAKEYNLVTDKILSDFQSNITREKFCELVVKLYEALSGKKAEMPKYNKFIDTNNIAILKANHLEIVKGKSENKFAPNDKIKREEIAVMFHGLLSALEINPIVTEQYVYFSDEEQISQWAKNAIQLLNKLGIINGVGNDRIDPQGNVTREQAMVLVKRIFEKYVQCF